MLSTSYLIALLFKYAFLLFYAMIHIGIGLFLNLW